MTKVYNSLGSVIIEQDGKDKIYLNPDDIRLSISGEVFLINDAQLNRMYQLGKYDQIVDGSGGEFTSAESCETYLLSSIASCVSISDGSAEPQFDTKIIESNTEGTYTTIQWLAGGTLIKTQTIVEGNPSNTDPDPTKTITITNS